MNMPPKLTFCSLEKKDINDIVSAFKANGWNKTKDIYEAYLLEKSNNQRTIIVAKEDGKFCGYVTIKWKSDYSSFEQQSIPEIADLNVLPSYQKKGIGTQLIRACEKMASERGLTNIGIGVGMTADYGNAQRLYVQLGYVTDGQGLHCQNLPVSYGYKVLVDDDLVIYLIKLIDGK